MKKQVLLLTFVFCISHFLVAQSFNMVWETDPILKTPESVLFDARRNQIYVSNINGKPLDKDNNGFISILNVDGSIKTLKWVTGMHAPKGMAFNDSSLYVTDIDRIHIIDIEKGKIIKTMKVKGAQFLNDMAFGPDGFVYISDMSTNQILVYNGSKISTWLEHKELVSPNGLAFFKENLYVGTKNKLLKVELADKTVSVKVDETGSIDGLICLSANKFVISDWSGRVMMINEVNKIVLQNTSEAKIQAADLGYIPDKKLVLIPTFFDNRVVARELP